MTEVERLYAAFEAASNAYIAAADEHQDAAGGGTPCLCYACYLERRDAALAAYCEAVDRLHRTEAQA
jgi:hypothetical protein